jgi:3-oxoacyl-[acyl-carrier-protein] synthase-3
LIGTFRLVSERQSVASGYLLSMRCTIDGVAIRAIAAALPAKRVDVVADLSPTFGAEEMAKVSKSTGITAFRQVDEQTTADLCVAAVEQLRKLTKLDVATVDALVFVTQTPDYLMPATGAVLQARLGLPKSAITFDVNSGCAGYVHGLYLAASLIKGSGLQRALVLAGDTSTRLIHPDDRALRVLFGDAGSATLVETDPSAKPMSFVMGTDGAGANALIVPGRAFRPAKPGTANPECLFMDGIEVMNFGLREVPPTIDAVLDQHGWRREDVDEFVLHQANAIMLQFVTRKMGVPAAKVPILMQETGNTGPASIPLAISVKGGTKPKTVLCGFGVGLTWGAVACDLSATVVAPPVDA